MRKLEIGPGKKHLRGYETIGLEFADIQWDVTHQLPYEDNTFDKILASHVIEHIEWTVTKDMLADWVRVLKYGGQMELWTPDFLKIAEIVRKAEDGVALPDERLESHVKTLRRRNKEKSPYIWANYRLMADSNPNAVIKQNRHHKAFFTFNYLKGLMKQAGLHDVIRLDRDGYIGPYNNGWAVLGVQGTK